MIGVLLSHLGTPERAEKKFVKQYLAEFLTDAKVIDIPKVLRFFLVYGIILPIRTTKSTQAYQKIWTSRGSPLRFHLDDLVSQLQIKMGKDFFIQPAMRYGTPSFQEAFQKCAQRAIKKIIIFPLYPQFSQATTESTMEHSLSLAHHYCPQAEISFIPPFFQESTFIQTYANHIQATQPPQTSDHFLFSFHGLPEKQIQKADVSKKHCLHQNDCCDHLTAKNGLCYRAQCLMTAKAIATTLQLKHYSVSFQSRLGPTRWIGPCTETELQQLPKKGVHHLTVICPSFTIDCLETLEEIGIRGRALFLKAGGSSFHLAPSLNSDPTWVESLLKGFLTQV